MRKGRCQENVSWWAINTGGNRDNVDGWSAKRMRAEKRKRQKGPMFTLQRCRGSTRRRVRGTEPEQKRFGRWLDCWKWSKGIGWKPIRCGNTAENQSSMGWRKERIKKEARKVMSPAVHQIKWEIRWCLKREVRCKRWFYSKRETIMCSNCSRKRIGGMRTRAVWGKGLENQLKREEWRKK